MFFDGMEAITDPTVITGVNSILMATFLDFTDKGIELGAHRIQLFSDSGFDLIGKRS